VHSVDFKVFGQDGLRMVCCVTVSYNADGE